jgi:hypothetical protein
MGSLRHMPKETPVLEPRKPRLAKPPDPGPIMTPLKSFIKLVFQDDIMRELGRGFSDLDFYLGYWSWSGDDGCEIGYKASVYREWLKEMIDNGWVAENEGNYGLPGEKFPSREAVELYHRIPLHRDNAVSASDLANLVGLSVEAIDRAFGEFGSYGLFVYPVMTTQDNPPRFYRPF